MREAIQEMDLMKEVEKQHLKEDVPPFRPGDTVRVHVRAVSYTHLDVYKRQEEMA